MRIINFLQHPFVKYFLSPIGYIAYGTIIALFHASQFNWRNFILLALIVLFSQRLDRYFYHQTYLNTKRSSQLILYVFEIGLILTTIMFILSNNWIINLLVLFYIAYIHLQYAPFPFQNTFAQYCLKVYFCGFSLNIVAYYSQTLSLTPEFIQTFIPVALLIAGITIYMQHLLYFNSTRKSQRKLYTITALGLCIAASLSGFYFALPSQSWYSVQIIYLLLLLISLLPLLGSVTTQKQREKKINYLYALPLVFNVLYACAILL